MTTDEPGLAWILRSILSASVDIAGAKPGVAKPSSAGRSIRAAKTMLAARMRLLSGKNGERASGFRARRIKGGMVTRRRSGVRHHRLATRGAVASAHKIRPRHSWGRRYIRMLA